MPPDLARDPEDLSDYLAETTSAWRTILPEVDPDAIELVGRLEALARWVAAVKAQALAPFRLNFAEWTTLGVLRISTPDCRRSPTELRHRVGQTSAGMTRVLAKLEGEGWIRREPCVEDRRRSDVVLTREGRLVAEESHQAVQSTQSRLLAHFDKTDRDRAKHELDRLLRAFATRPNP